MERSEAVCCRDCSKCKLPQAMTMNTMMACAIDQMFQRQLKLEDALMRIEDKLSFHPDESINLAKVSHIIEEEYESMDAVQDTGKDGEK